MTVPDPRHMSRALLDGPDRAVARSMMKAVGFTDDDLSRPQVGVAHCWIGTMPCNWNHRELAQEVMAGIRAAGGTPIEVNTIAINDAITTGSEGMKTSLVSREVIADSVELVARGHMFDALVVIAGCDKTIPAMAMALGRLDIPGLLLYSGSIHSGACKSQGGMFGGRKLTIQDVYEAVGAFNAGRISIQEFKDVEDHACPGVGACGGQFTANTMATACEMLGISPMGFNGIPAPDAPKARVALECGRIVMDLLRRGVTPRSLVTRQSFENAIAGVMATGGSTNAVLTCLGWHTNSVSSSPSTISTGFRAALRSWRTCGRGGPTPPWRCMKPAAWRWWASAWRKPGCCMVTSARSRAWRWPRKSIERPSRPASA